MASSIFSNKGTTSHLRRNVTSPRVRTRRDGSARPLDRSIPTPVAAVEVPQVQQPSSIAEPPRASHVPLVPARKDGLGLELRRGDVLAALQAVRLSGKRLTLDEFNAQFQCPNDEPDLDGASTGSWHILRMAPPTKETVALMCAFLETGCAPWKNCKNYVNAFRRGNYPTTLDTKVDLYRVQGNQLYLDWPWGVERVVASHNQPRFGVGGVGSSSSRSSGSSGRGTRADIYAIDTLVKEYVPERLRGGGGQRDDRSVLLQLVLSVLSVDDSIFFMNTMPAATTPWNHPLPVFSTAAPSRGHAELPWPALEGFISELRLAAAVQRAAAPGTPPADADYDRATQQVAWMDRRTRAVFHAEEGSVPQMMLDQAALRPDLIDIFVSNATDKLTVHPWHPQSQEDAVDLLAAGKGSGGKRPGAPQDQKQGQGARPGFVQFVRNQTTRAIGADSQVSGYKYVVVEGSDVSPTSRLASLLAHSGAVVIMPVPVVTGYHFSARLVPWINYVPLSYSGADLLDRIAWLREHDRDAAAIAANARALGKSFLRAEDSLCFVARALTAVAALENNGTAVLPFAKPSLLERLSVGTSESATLYSLLYALAFAVPCWLSYRYIARLARRAAPAWTTEVPAPDSI